MLDFGSAGEEEGDEEEGGGTRTRVLRSGDKGQAGRRKVGATKTVSCLAEGINVRACGEVCQAKVWCMCCCVFCGVWCSCCLAVGLAMPRLCYSPPPPTHRPCSSQGYYSTQVQHKPIHQIIRCGTGL